MAYFGNNRTKAELDQLELISEGILYEVQHAASRGLTIEEVLSGYSISDLNELPEYDRKLFMEHFSYGRSRGLASMSDNLFSQATQKGGTPAVLAYLVRFGKNFPNIDENSALATITIKDETGKGLFPDSTVKVK